MDASEVPGASVEQLRDLMATLRTECPWDRVQTHGSLRRHLLEEAHEVLDALDRVVEESPVTEDADRDLAEELGDLLFQIVFHAHLAEERGAFDLDDVARGVHDKLVLRHPGIFDPDVDEAPLDWEQAKVREKGRESVLDGIPTALPALALATKLVSKARSVDPDLIGAFLLELDDDGRNPLGRDLLERVVVARAAGDDPEAALRQVTTRLTAFIKEHEISPDDRGR